MRTKLVAGLILLALVTVYLGGFCLAQDKGFFNKQRSATPADAPQSIEGTTWAGIDSDGDFYEYTFLPKGQLRYRTNTSRSRIVTFEDKGDVWAQNGAIVIICISNYSTNLGTMKGNEITGDAWNVKERRWTWEVKKK